MKYNAYAVPNPSTPGTPIIFDSDICNGCNLCVKICLMDIFIPNEEKGKAPLILYPEECYYDGCCVDECPEEGAIKLSHPLMQRVRWKRKLTEEHFRV